MMRVLITGILGQDSSFLAEMLLAQNYDVYGVYRRISSGTNFENIESIKNHPRLHLVEGDLCDSVFMSHLIQQLQPDEMYNLGAQSHVSYSFNIPVETLRVNAEAVLIQLEAIRKFSPKTKYLQASTSEIYGGVRCPVEGYSEQSPFYPRSPYGIAKVAALHYVINHRDRGLFACNSIGFNHSSHRRGVDFATRKITKGIAGIVAGKEKHLYMGNIQAFRDESHAKDICNAMILILQQSVPDDYVVATGTGASIEEMIRYVCGLANLKFEDVYRQDERYMRPSDVPYLLGNASKLRNIGWQPQYTWQDLLKEMYENDLRAALLGK